MVHVLDLGLRGHLRVVAAAALDGPGGLVVVDPGGTSTLGGLRAGLAGIGRTLDEIQAVLVTHVHLDHSGALGTLVRANPRLPVYVHERGAAHVVDPTKLVRSAGRLYGEGVDQVWGEVLPVPAGNVHVLRGGERLRLAGHDVRVAYTPGHAWHHVSYFDEETGTALVGDTGGMRFGTPLFVTPPTPPPDIDIDAWLAGLDVIEAWHPRQLLVTHFGAYGSPAEHLDDLRTSLRDHAELARTLLAAPAADDAEREERFIAGVLDRMRARGADPAEVREFELVVPIDHCWLGLARYWRKKEQA